MSQATGPAWRDRLSMQCSSEIPEVRENAKTILGEIARLERELAEARTQPEAGVSSEDAVGECIKIVEAQLAKLGGRWSLDSAYLSTALANLRNYQMKVGGACLPQNGSPSGPIQPPPNPK